MEFLYDRYQRGVYGIISRIVKDPGAAEEVMQQTFLRAWNRIEQYDPSKSGLFTWLCIIGRSAAIDRVRLKRYETRQKTESFDVTVYDSGMASNPGAALDVQRLLDRLDQKYQVVLDLKYLQGYSQSEVAEALEIPLGTVKTRLRQAVLALRETLKEEKKYFIGIFLLT